MNKKILQKSIILSLSGFIFLTGNLAHGIAVPQTTAGHYSATGTTIYDYISHTSTINTLAAINSAIINVGPPNIGVTTPITINGAADRYSIEALNTSQININGNLTATVGAGDTWVIPGIFLSHAAGNDGMLAFIDSKITLNGETNTINSLSSSYANSEAVFHAAGNSEIEVTGNLTTVTVNQSRVITSASGSVVTFSNGKYGDESALLKAISSSNQRMIQADSGGQIILDRVELDGINSFNNGRMLFSLGEANPAITQQAKITFLYGSFNRYEGLNRVGATAFEASTFGEIEVKGYSGKVLDIRTGGQNEAGIRSLGGGKVTVNTGKYADFTTKIETSNRINAHGIAVGSQEVLASTSPTYLGGQYAGASVEIYGTTQISTASSSSYGLKVFGDGAKIGIYNLDGQTNRSTLHSASTALKFASANGYHINIDGSKAESGGQLIHLESIDITNDGNTSENSNGVYSGNLIQAGSHTEEITVDGHQNNIKNVADSVKNAKLVLIDSTATGNDAKTKDLINVTYGGGTTNVTETASSDLTVDAKQSTLQGSVFTDYTVADDGKASELNLNLSENSFWKITKNSAETNTWQGTADVTGNFVTNLNLNKSSVIFQHTDGSGGIDTQDPSTFHKLYVAGNYHSENNGYLEMNVVLGDDNSNTDKLIVGGNTSGTTYVHFNNIDGLGAETDKGIEVIEVLGNSDGVFIKENAVVAGLYEYNLVKGGNGGIANNWYLSNLDLYRPETGSYLSNMALNSQMFDLRLFERDTVLQHAATTKQKTVIDPKKEFYNDNVWMMNSYSRTKQNFTTNQLKSDTHLYILRMGVDLYDKINSNGSNTKFGITGAYGHGTQTTSSNILGRTSHGKVDGYLLGLYGTWFKNAYDKTDWYVDTWVQHGWFDNKIQGDTLTDEDYNTTGWSYSLEIGKTIPYRVTKDHTYSFQPKAQFIYSDLSGNNHIEQNGTTISFNGTSNFMTRIGLRWISERNDYKKNNVFIELDWIHNTSAYGISSLGESVYQKGNKNLGEVRIGYEQELNDRWHLFGNVNAQFGKNNYKALEGIISLKYVF